MLVRRLILVLLIILISSWAFAWETWNSNRPYRDYWGNQYKYYNNLWKDSDNDGIINYYDYNDRNPNVWMRPQRGPNSIYDYRMYDFHYHGIYR